MRKPYIINSRGEKEIFSFRKVYKSARKVGASKPLALKIAQEIEKQVYSGVKTIDIFKEVKKKLYQEHPPAALRFSLKEAMRKLGPTGFPFEKYVGEIFLKNGFQVRLNQYLDGSCCSGYEIDFLAEKDNVLNVGECKYRNLFGERIHLDIALANYARFLDIKNYFLANNSKEKTSNYNLKSVLVTNTKFTSKAIKYSQCMGVELMGWKYPKNRGLEYFIDSQKLYPITILPSFKNIFSDIFQRKRMMLVEDVLRIDTKDFAKKNKLPLNYVSSLVREAKLLLEN